MLAIKGAPAVHDFQTSCLVPTLNYVFDFPIFLSGVYCGYIRPRGVFIICVLVTAATKYA